MRISLQISIRIRIEHTEWFLNIKKLTMYKITILSTKNELIEHVSHTCYTLYVIKN